MIMGQELQPRKIIMIGSCIFEEINKFTYLYSNVNVDNNVVVKIKTRIMKSFHCYWTNELQESSQK